MIRNANYRFGTLLLLALCAGCGSSGLPTLTGAVTIDGKPAPAGIELSFLPTFPGGAPSVAKTDAEGNYVAQFTAREYGIQAGEHIVQLMPFVVKELQQGDPLPPNPLKQMPKSYFQEITRVTIEPGSNSYDIDLKTK